MDASQTTRSRSRADPTAEPARFYAHARDEGRHAAHCVAGAVNLEDAAMIFAEHWGGADAADLTVIVRDGDTGEERCFVIDLDRGEAEPCA